MRAIVTSDAMACKNRDRNAFYLHRLNPPFTITPRVSRLFLTRKGVGRVKLGTVSDGDMRVRWQRKKDA